MGDVVPEIILGDPAAEYLGEPPVDITFGVAVGVSLGVMYGVTENLWPACLEAVPETKRTYDWHRSNR